MKRVVFLLLLLLTVSPAMADEGTKTSAPSTMTPEKAADRVLAATTAGDTASLKAMANDRTWDPWRVADELCRRGLFDAADAYAKAAPWVGTAKLPAYIKGRRGAPSDADTRKRLAAMNQALRAKDWPKALAVLGPAPATLGRDVLSLRLASGRASALGGLVRLHDAVDLLTAVGTAAEELGWLEKAAWAHIRGAYYAWRGASYAKAAAALDRGRLLQERLGDELGTAQTLGRLGLIQQGLGEYDNAQRSYEGALRVQKALGDEAGAAITLGNLGNVHSSRGDFKKALDVFERALAAKEAVGDEAGAASTRSNMGRVYCATGQYAAALTILQKAHDVQEGLGDKRAAARTLGTIAIVHDRMGDAPKALATYERTMDIQRAVGDKAAEAMTLGNIGSLYSAQGDLAKALSMQERALSIHQALGNRGAAAKTLGNLGNVHQRLGDLQRALGMYKQALRLQRELGDKRTTAMTLMNMGVLYDSMGLYATALSTHEEARTIQLAIGDRDAAATSLGAIGVVYDRLGDHARALTAFRRALAEQEALGDRAGAAITRSNVGSALQLLGRHDEAKASHAQALKELVALGDRANAAKTLVSLAILSRHAGDLAEALALHRRALALQKALGDKLGAVQTRLHVGRLMAATGETDDARKIIERCVREARRLRAAPVLVRALSTLVELHMRAREPGRALGVGQQALTTLEDMLAGLGEEEGAVVRSKHTNLFTMGALAAAAEGDLATALTFLESGRAGGLLESLNKRQEVRWIAERLPADLRQSHAAAEEGVRRAREAHARAFKRRKLAALRDARRMLDLALEQQRAVASRIQRSLKRDAGNYYPRPETLEAIQASLHPDQALVLYGWGLGDVFALIVRKKGARAVVTSSVEDVGAAIKALNASNRDVDPTPALKRLRALLVAPLQLGVDVKRVLVSPDGPLCTLPLGALFEQPVAATPSGSTHLLLLREERKDGTGVLAIGDPDYGTDESADGVSAFRSGGRLLPLPATRIEVNAIGTVKLLGKEASEGGFRRAIAKQKRWRAVHFACHGRIDPQRPMFSSLALSRSAEDDGFLTFLELLRLDMPADLVVLSACDTASGQLHRGEGVLGLSRTFMYAGASRVLCSTWNVDDDATRALMIKFYELWNPKDRSKALGAAAALKGAQAYVRGQERWKHPYYWAPWVLWGLPD